MLNKREQEIEARERAATPGPWYWDTHDDWQGDNMLRSYKLRAKTVYWPTVKLPRVLLESSFWLSLDNDRQPKERDYKPAPENAEFIEHARLDVPYLLDTVAALREELAR